MMKKNIRLFSLCVDETLQSSMEMKKTKTCVGTIDGTFQSKEHSEVRIEVFYYKNNVLNDYFS